MAADKGPLHQFEIASIYDIKLYNTDISFTNSALSMLISIFVASIIFYFAVISYADLPDSTSTLVV